GNVVGFKNPIVHSFNKNSSVLKEEDREFFVNLRSRPNILLMGDSLGDASMDVEKSMRDYLEKFDILCVQDQTLDSTIEILNAVACPQNHPSDMNGGS
uniref:5'-nucleotidase n=1 Tax=Romanomermis culicivorax TaxID=13658 RepID=A0A915K7U2_ROMCU